MGKATCQQALIQNLLYHLHDTCEEMLTFPIRRYYLMKVLAIIIYEFEIEMQDLINIINLTSIAIPCTHGCPFLCGRIACMPARFIMCNINSRLGSVNISKCFAGVDRRVPLSPFIITF